MFGQGTLTEGKGSRPINLLVKIACFIIKVTNIFKIKSSLISTSYNKEVNCAEPSPSVRVPWFVVNMS
jgi:hypothetical protein